MLSHLLFSAAVAATWFVVAPGAGAPAAPSLPGATSWTPPAASAAAARAVPMLDTEERVAAALPVLSKLVLEQSHPAALKSALHAYFSYKAAHPEKVRNPYLYFVDYGLGNRTPRGYVFDMEALELVEGPFTVAHGRGSARPGEGVPSKFSNIKDSATSSLGLYLAQETYAFRGKSGGRRYRSTGLRLRGLSGRFNGAARARGIVVHGAPYVSASQAGRSEGCPALEEARAQRLIPKISNGGLVFLFSPNDESWLRNDPWAAGAARKLASSG